MSKVFTVHTDAGHPIIFLVHPDPAGGLTAKAELHSIFVQGDTMSDLQSAAAEAVRVHFAPEGAAMSNIALDPVALDAAVDAASNALDSMPDPGWLQDAVEAGIGAYLAQARNPCRWTYDADIDLWTSSCGEDWTFIDGGPTDNRCKFCHGCGKPIEVTP